MGKVQPKVYAAALPNQLETEPISAAHRGLSPACAGQPVIDLAGLGGGADTMIVKVREQGGEYIATCAGRCRRAHGATAAEAIATLRKAIEEANAPAGV